MARRTKSRGRGRLSSFDLLPPECDALISWAAQELSDRDRTQAEIHADFVEQALTIQSETGLSFEIPSASSFNRFSVKQAKLTRNRDETRKLVAALSDSFNAKETDDLTILTAETINALVFHMVSDLDERASPLEVMRLASAFKSTLQASAISTDRRIKQQSEFDKKVGDAVTSVAKAKGLTAETAEAIKAEILGVSA